MVEDSAEELRRPVADRRRQQRLPTRGTALVKLQRRELRADTVDISPHGVCLTLPRALEVGSTCELDLEILGTAKRTSVVARVCFCLQGKNGYRIGLNCALEDFVDDGAL
ncbi:MAG TPA: PilZ domain-containing protein [Steroidobacteraceae bacterium]|jgi:hypothetical protein|nr:PilZ domain-containing protein [Steroidobacteraceae bacterium]